jgi:hypothetical protein
MKNIFLLPTDEPSRLYLNMKGILSKDELKMRLKNQNINITSDEEIKEGDWYLWQGYDGEYYKEKCKYLLYEGKKTKHLNCNKKTQFKVILTTDLRLIADGIQAIDDTFLEWFVKNPTCEFVDTLLICGGNSVTIGDYLLDIPQEEPKQEESKQETLEEAAENWVRKPIIGTRRESFMAGAKWQAEKDKNKYSEEDVKKAFEQGEANMYISQNTDSEDSILTLKSDLNINEWFKQFKKK